ncbi:cold shock domain-containing protein, partial [Thiocystis minor]|uniref:cold-shock protein n=1 Tax=Thiocystis minor TaxID=61597 RepID=UPI001912F3FF
MEGTVVSFVPDKQYGFLTGSDGHSYFFHLSAFRPPQPASAIETGMLLHFDPTPGPKGLRAQSLRIEHTQAMQLIAPTQFLVTKAQRPSNGRVLSETPSIECRSDASIDAAKDAVIALAKRIPLHTTFRVRHLPGLFDPGGEVHDALHAQPDRLQTGLAIALA